MLSFEEKLRNHAQISLIHGLGLGQTVRPLFVGSSLDPSAREFLKVMVREAYALGVPKIDVSYIDHELEALQFMHAPADLRAYVFKYTKARSDEIVASNGSAIRIDGNDGIGLFENVDKSIPPAYNANVFKMRESILRLSMGMKRPWHVCAAATERWAQALGISVADLWEHIFACSGADRADALEYVRKQLDKLSGRAKTLNSMKIRELHFKSPGTDLTVGLSQEARWVGGKRQAADGTWFAPNWPTAESFTTPDWRTVSGAVTATKILSIDGTVVKDLKLTFNEGRIVDMTASEGLDAFKSLTEVDMGASQLGEIAVVDMRSAIARRNLVFLEILFDENAADHLAVGKAYPAAIEGGTEMTAEQLAQIGCNTSNVHRDIMISNDQTTLTALTWKGVKIPLQKRGCFVGELALTA